MGKVTKIGREALQNTRRAARENGFNLKVENITLRVSEVTLKSLTVFGTGGGIKPAAYVTGRRTNK